MRDGRLAIDCEGHPFLVGPEMVVRGPVRVEVRCRARGTAGAGAVWYRSPTKPSFDGGRTALPACGPELGVRETRLAVAETILQLRLDFSRPRSGGYVEVDWIRLYAGDAEPASGPIAEWSFDR
jgi:hypothetical protein